MIFSTVTQFVEQVDQRIVSRYGDLDQMVCSYVGPAWDAIKFRPKWGTKHPDYPMMFSTDTEVTRMAGAVAEVNVTYAGILQTSGVSFYKTTPVISVSPVQGSRDFTEGWWVQTGYGPPTDMGGGVSVMNPLLSAGTLTTTVRYIGSQCSVHYQVYPQPHGYQFSTMGLSWVNWNVLSRVQGGRQTSLTNASSEQVKAFLDSIPPIPPLFGAELGFEARQRGNWFDCTEIYGPTF